MAALLPSSKRGAEVHAPPSAYSATRLIRGEPGAVGEVLFHCAFRTLLVGAGIALVVDRPRDVWKPALAGAVAIELFLLGYAANREALAKR